ncbi:hypothetical protein ACWCRF_30780 [Streptomyces sp. NPDC002405]
MTTRSAFPPGPPTPRPPGTPDVSALLGEWVSTDQHASNGARRLSVTSRGEGMFVRAFGACGPQPRDWGKAPAVLNTAPGGSTLPATPSADDIDAAEAVAFLAERPLGSRQVILAGYPNRGLPTIDVHTVHPADARKPTMMYPAHFHLLEGATPT